MTNHRLRLVVPLVLLPLLHGTVEARQDSVPAARVVPARAVDASWTTWRGPLGNGVAPTGHPPTSWSEEENVRWKVALPGKGSSSPILLGDRIFLTTAVETDEGGEGAPAPEPEPEQGDRRGRGRGSAAPTTVYEFRVLCLDRADGAVLWDTVVQKTVPHEAGHPTSSQASNSPLTDGKHIYAYFGSRGMHCLDMDGKLVWSKDIGRMQTRNGFGEGSSPALFGDTLVINWDHEGDSFIVALDKRTGEERWRRARDEVTSWATPRIVKVGDRAQVIVPASALSVAYDLETGETVWTLEGMTANCIPSPLYSDGVVYLMSGYRGASLLAVRLQGAKGSLGESESVLWTHRKGTSYTPSGLLYDGLLYFVQGNSAILSCLDAASGEVIYEGQRLGEERATIYSSPVAADGRVYLTSREGTTVVVQHGADFKVLATNRLDDGFDASAAVVGDELYLRGAEHLYCLAQKKTQKKTQKE